MYYFKHILKHNQIHFQEVTKWYLFDTYDTPLSLTLFTALITFSCSNDFLQIIWYFLVFSKAFHMLAVVQIKSNCVCYLKSPCISCRQRKASCWMRRLWTSSRPQTRRSRCHASRLQAPLSPSISSVTVSRNG